jgi:hypothetical protein
VAYIVLIAWIVQASVGISMFVGWLRHGRHGAGPMLTHVGVVLVALALWAAFIVTGSVIAAWSTFVVLTVALTFGDIMLIARSRRLTGRTTFWKDYGAAIAKTFRGMLPRRVTFHALFSPVVYFLCLGVCMGATVAVNA